MIATLWAALTASGGPLLAQECVPPPDGLVSWWPGEDDAVDIVRGNDGSLEADATFGPALIGQGFRFDGSGDVIDVGVSLGLDPTEQLTVECWWRSNLPATTSAGYFVNKFTWDLGDDDDSYRFGHRGRGDALEFTVVTEGGPDPDVVHVVESSDHYLFDGEFHHVAGTYDGAELRLYFDGMLIGAAPASGPIVETPTTDLLIGAAHDRDVGRFLFLDGTLDELSIYDRALSSAEIRAIFEAGAAGKCQTVKIDSRGLEPAQVGVFTSQPLEAVLGVEPLTWTVVEGTLVEGMELSPDGVLSGTPAEGGQFPITVRVVDGNGDEDFKQWVQRVLLAGDSRSLRITKVGTPPVPGQRVDYFILVRNIGHEVTAPDLQVIEFLDPLVTFVAAQPDPVSVDDGAVVWDVSPLEPGDFDLFIYQVDLPVDAPLGEIVRGGPACTVLADCLTACGSSVPCKQDCVADIDCDSADAPIRNATDPNDKQVIARPFVQPFHTLTYVIRFENIAHDVAAQDIFLTDGLDSDLDLSTVRVFTTDRRSLPLPPDSTVTVFEAQRTRTIEVDGVPVEQEYTEKWDATLDAETRTLSWEIQNIYLEPAAGSKVIFSVNPLPNRPSETEVKNEGDIRFDFGETIRTNEVVTILDDSVPIAFMDTLSSTTPSTTFPISWNGTDEVGEIERFSVFVAEDGGPFRPLLEDTTQTSVEFDGVPGKTYEFIAVATDTAGNVETQEAIAETATTVILPKPFHRGDTNTDGVLDISDPLLGLFHLTDGTELDCEDAADSNDDGVHDFADAVFTLGCLFLAAECPPPPGAIDCGLDPTADGLACGEYGGCE